MPSNRDTLTGYLREQGIRTQRLERRRAAPSSAPDISASVSELQQKVDELEKRVACLEGQMVCVREWMEAMHCRMCEIEANCTEC